MKTITKSLTVALLALVVAGSADVLAQGKGNGHGKDNNPGKGHDKDKHDNPGKGHDKHDRVYANNHHDYRWNDHGRHHSRHEDRSRVVHYRSHHHDYRSYRPIRWVSAHHNHARPRYVYYQDYNVYYDCHRDVYVSLSNRGWVISAGIPIAMARVNFATAVAVGVEYYDDDINYYVTRKRPSYFSIRAEW